jgi:hypothetical protein
VYRLEPEKLEKKTVMKKLDGLCTGGDGDMSMVEAEDNDT